jgi:hypothetical protein
MWISRVVQVFLIETRNSGRLSGVCSFRSPGGCDDAKSRGRLEHWRERAAQVRVLATTMKQIEAQAVMVMLAKDYDKLANRAGLRAKGEVPPGGW